jgi:hypothetical protein
MNDFAPITARLERRIRREFPADPVLVLEVLSELELEAAGQDRERILAAIVFVAGGDVEALERAIEVAEADWRDVLVAAGLERDDWRQHLDEALGGLDDPDH